MRNHIGNLLLTLGTVLGGIAAANSAKATRWQSLDEAGYPGEYLSAAVLAADGETELAAAGAELTPEVVAALKGAGHDRALVKDPPLDSEVLPRGSAELEGRILDGEVVLGQETNVIPAGRMVTADLLERAAAAGMDRIGIRIGDAESSMLTAPVAVAEGLTGDALAEAEAMADAFNEALAEALDGGTVAADLELVEDVTLAAGTFLDAQAVERIGASDGDEVEVRIMKDFSMGGWDQLWLFAVALVALGAGVAVKRSIKVVVSDEPSDAGGAAGPKELRSKLETLVADVQSLRDDAAEMDMGDLRREVEPLLSGQVYDLVEGRTVVQAAYGTSTFAAIYAPLASGERYLNRCWSAAVDGYEEEARACLDDALPLLQEALEAMPAGSQPA